MKICYLSHATNYHTIKWCNYFVNLGYDVHLISFEEGEIEGVKVHVINTGAKRGGSDIQKLKYLGSSRKIKNKIEEINPDIVHVHFATSYGIACALSGIKGYFLSVWGYDVYDFPEKSIFHKLILKYSLYRSDKILSTSRAMKKQTEKFTSKDIYVTPFGVNTKIFKKNVNTIKKNNSFIIGTIKLLSPKYGIHILLEALKIFIENNPEVECQLRIAGNGPDESRLKLLAKELGIDDEIEWLGFLKQEDVVEELNNFDIVVIPSILDSESFGVSAVEAQACEVPVIVTNVGGLTESTKPNVTSLVVEPNNPNEIYNKILVLYNNKELRHVMGKEGRKFVKENFELNNNFEYIDSIYKEYLNGK